MRAARAGRHTLPRMSRYVLKIEGERHGFVNMLSDKLTTLDGTRFAASRVRHPLCAFGEVVVDAADEEEALAALVRACESLVADCDSVLGSLGMSADAPPHRPRRAAGRLPRARPGVRMRSRPGAPRPPMLLSVLRTPERSTPSPRQRLKGGRLMVDFARMSAPDALELEHQIMLASSGCVKTYLSHLRRQAYNIACNPALAAVDPARLIHMTNEEFAAGTVVERVQSEEQERMRGFIELLKEKYENVVKAQSSDSILNCRNCGSNDISFSQKQTRGADESSTIFCQCQVCSKRWRLS